MRSKIYPPNIKTVEGVTWDRSFLTESSKSLFSQEVREKWLRGREVWPRGKEVRPQNLIKRGEEVHPLNLSLLSYEVREKAWERSLLTWEKVCPHNQPKLVLL